MNHGLSKSQVKLILACLARNHVEAGQAGLFGSRATGKYRPNSDIDLVIYGLSDETSADRIYTELNDSSLPMKVDVVSYNHVAHDALKAHIEAVMKPIEAL